MAHSNKALPECKWPDTTATVMATDGQGAAHHGSNVTEYTGAANSITATPKTAARQRPSDRNWLVTSTTSTVTEMPMAHEVGLLNSVASTNQSGFIREACQERRTRRCRCNDECQAPSP